MAAQAGQAEARLRFTRTAEADPEALTAELMERFVQRERGEIARVADVVRVIGGERCITNALLAHFGEARDEPCGHCSFCESGKAAVFPTAAPLPPIDSRVRAADLRALAAAHPDALGEPRQQARFLCGLVSPGVSRARLGRNPLFGALDEHRFGDVLAWCESIRG